jgi:glucokinase
MILAADLGGTKTVLALFDAAEGIERPRHEETFPSNQYDSLEAIVGPFLDAAPAKPQAACFGAAGPVINRRSQITNLPWVIDADAVCTLNVGQRDPTGAIGVIAPGTGLGGATSTYHGMPQYVWKLGTAKAHGVVSVTP